LNGVVKMFASWNFAHGKPVGGSGTRDHTACTGERIPVEKPMTSGKREGHYPNGRRYVASRKGKRWEGSKRERDLDRVEER
jgi:hypothetical protein